MNGKLINRMKKLLALTESGNEHEAMSATRKLHVMLAKHNISIEDLSDIDELNFGEDEIELSNFPWKRRIAYWVSRLYFCQNLYQTTRKNYTNFKFIGTEENRTFAIYIFKMIVKTIERESRFQSKRMYGKIDSRFITSFSTGACITIGNRCEELIDSAKCGTLEDDGGNLLPALLSTYEQMDLNINNWLSEKYGELKSISSNLNITDQNGLNKGKEAGSKVQLTRVIQSKQSPKLLS